MQSIYERVVRPPIVCICGSTKFRKEFEQANFDLTIQGKIVVTVGCYPRDDDGNWNPNIVSDQQKFGLDALHMHKILLCDEIFVVNVGGYVGESTAREIAFAKLSGKTIIYLEPAEPMGKVNVRLA